MNEVDVRWWPAHRRADEALTAHAYAVRGPGVVETGRLCPACAASEHGRPWLRHDGEKVEVSLSRSGRHLVTVIADAPVGVDVESVAGVAASWQPELVLAAGEEAHVRSAGDAAALWTAKEAILKYLGTGLATPMTEVSLAAYDVRQVQAPVGYVAAVCVGSAGNGLS